MNLLLRQTNLLLLLCVAMIVGCIDSNQSETKEAYLFAYFTGNGPGEESIHYALSWDGYTYRALNDNKPIIDSREISTSGGVRDPHILRGEDGNFYMVVTDLYVPEMGWQNVAMVLLKSDDLVNWTHSVVNIPETFKEYSDVFRVWAPQTIYDEHAGKYMIYFSMLQPGGYDIIYYAYADEDFTGLESAPEQLYYNPGEFAAIDGDIVVKDGKYHLFYKTEGDYKGIARAISDSLTGGYTKVGDNVDLSNDQVEGSGIFKLNGTDEYILMYDVYIAGGYQFTKSTDLEHFEIIDEEVSMNFRPRHGSVLPITKKEAERLLEKWGKDTKF